MTTTVLHSSVLETLGQEIVAGDLPAGAVVTLDQLQVRFHVSRTVTRECMRILESMNLVQSRRRVGIVVRPSSEWTVLDSRVIRWRLDGPGRGAQLRDLTELRIAIEPAAASGAARRATPEQRAALSELAGRLRALGEAGRLAEFLEVDIAFHSLLLRASGNSMFGALEDFVAEVLAGRTHHGLMPDHPVPAALDAHEGVALAVQGGDPAAAERWMRELVTEVRTALVDPGGDTAP
ncbi:MAG TPA: FCD domain-containing protein [Cellulomonadaceae bacterium]|nr:FCD domain-containing protein [Cellulomonadaceae bacterium]